MGAEGAASAGDAAGAVHQRVRAERKSRGLSLEALAAQAGIRYQFLAEIERGRRNPSAVTLLKIASGLGVALPTLLATEGGQEAAPAKAYGAGLVKDAPGRIAHGRLFSELHHWDPKQLRLAREVLQAVRRWAGRRTA